MIDHLPYIIHSLAVCLIGHPNKDKKTIKTIETMPLLFTASLATVPWVSYSAAYKGCVKDFSVFFNLLDKF